MVGGQFFGLGFEIRVFQFCDELLKDRPDLVFIALHQQGIFKGVLRHLAQFFEIFAQHLDLFGAGNNAAVRALPDRLHRYFR